MMMMMSLRSGDGHPIQNGQFDKSFHSVTDLLKHVIAVTIMKHMTDVHFFLLTPWP